MPFVQGKLRQEPISVVIKSECAHCARTITIKLDNELRYRVVEEETDPLIFIPIVNFKKLTDPSIIDAF